MADETLLDARDEAEVASLEREVYWEASDELMEDATEAALEDTWDEYDSMEYDAEAAAAAAVV